MKQAVEECVLDHFTLQTPAQFFPKKMISGRVLRCDREKIYVEIFQKQDVSTIESLCNSHHFDISFNVNTVPYKIQHKTLDLFHKKNLHSHLIANQIYDSRLNVDHIEHSNNFKGKLTAKLNDEQKKVVSSILKMNKLLPYLLFGPAGILSWLILKMSIK